MVYVLRCLQSSGFRKPRILVHGHAQCGSGGSGGSTGMPNRFMTRTDVGLQNHRSRMVNVSFQVQSTDDQFRGLVPKLPRDTRNCIIQCDQTRTQIYCNLIMRETPTHPHPHNLPHIYNPPPPHTHSSIQTNFFLGLVNVRIIKKINSKTPGVPKHKKNP